MRIVTGGASHALRWLREVSFGRARTRIGGTEVEDARRLADAEQLLGGVPEDGAWLDARTVDDLDLPLVFRAIDRTVTPTGAQALWRWLVAPAVRRDALDARERKLARFADGALRDRVTDGLAGFASSDAALLPRLLWDPRPVETRATPLIGVAAALVGCGMLAWWWPVFLLGALAMFIVALLVDEWSGLHLGRHARGLEVLGHTLDAAARLVRDDALPRELVDEIASDLAVRARLRRRLAILSVSDPFGLLEFVRAGLLVRLFAIRSCLRIVESERARLRRIVLWVGELDALTAVARLRSERRDLHVPELVDGPPQLEARGVIHPAIEGAIGNDLTLDASALLVTGSNMSGKSTFLRALAINAILARSIHTTFGTWRATMLHVRSVMRVTDDVASGLSTYAVQVESIGELVHAAAAGDTMASLFILDEPFSGTNPAIRVPIVVAVLQYLASRDLVVAATHDLEVATLLDDRFERAYFAEPGDAGFDRKLRRGVAPSTNALELLRRAGYPTAILERLISSTAAAGSRA